MFSLGVCVCVFVTCQNFQFWQVCSFDGLCVCVCVCLCVCLSVCGHCDTGRTVEPINIKLYPYMYPVCGQKCIVFGGDDIIDDVIRSKSRSNFKIAETPLVFIVQRGNKYFLNLQLKANVGGIFNIRCHFRYENASEVKNSGHFEFVEIFQIASILHQIWKDHTQIIQEKVISG